MSDKLHNEEIDVERIDGNVLSVESNKIKLKITTYAAIMEVQDAYMQEELDAKEEEIGKIKNQVVSGNLTEEEVKNADKDLATLTEQIESLKDVYEKFSVAHTRFMDLAKRALSLPNENFKKLSEKGYTMISGKKIELSNLESSYEEADKTLTNDENKDVFSNINNEDIKEEIERVINEEVYTNDDTGEEKTAKEHIINEVNATNFDENTLELASFVKNNIDHKNDEKLAEIANNYFDKKNATVKDDRTKKENSEIEETTIEIPKFSIETEGNWVEPEKPNTENYIDFESDKSIDIYLKSLEEKNRNLTAYGEELNSKISDLKDEKENAIRKHEEAKRKREEEKRRASETKKQVELLNSYKPKMDELIKANNEQEKLNSYKEEELKRGNEDLADINSKTTAITTETAAYAEETSKALEELKRLREEFSGAGYASDDSQYDSRGGRKI